MKHNSSSNCNSIVIFSLIFSKYSNVAKTLTVDENDEVQVLPMCTDYSGNVSVVEIEIADLYNFMTKGIGDDCFIDVPFDDKANLLIRPGSVILSGVPPSKEDGTISISGGDYTRTKKDFPHLPEPGLWSRSATRCHPSHPVKGYKAESCL